MINTDKDAKNNSLGETRTFDINAHSAESLKKQINSDNEKSLAERANERRTSRPQQTDVHAVRQQSRVGQPQNTGSHPRPAQSSVNPQANRQRPAQENAAVAVNRAQAGVYPSNTQAMENTSAVNRPPQAVNSVRPQRAVNESGVRAENRSVNPTGRPVSANNADRVQNARSVRVPQSSRGALVPVQNKNTQPAGRGNNVPQSRANSPTDIAKRDAKSRELMMKTKNTDIYSLASSGKTQSAKPADKNESERYEGSGEGGNTVVSVVKAIVYIVFIMVVSVFLAVGIILVGNDVFSFVKSDEVSEITVPEYATLDDIATILADNDIIKYPKIFKLFAVAKHDDGKFVAGTYTVNPMMNYEELLAEFKEKIVYETVDVTIPEGYTTDEIIDLFVNGYGIGTREGFIDVIENYEYDYWFIRELEENGRTKDRIYRLDGYLFPDTYQFYTTTSEATVIGKLLKRFSQIFTREYRDQCAQFGYSVDEMITLASMIEKEAASPSEFFNVSSVFHNRLNNPGAFPRLESDATVLYVLRHEAGENISLKASDLEYDTPYNTYKYAGLPPGPIANPSASAMLAALSPQKTNYYYFVANKGKTYFSETKAEHDAYIQSFRDSGTETNAEPQT